MKNLFYSVVLYRHKINKYHRITVVLALVSWLWLILSPAKAFDTWCKVIRDDIPSDFDILSDNDFSIEANGGSSAFVAQDDYNITYFQTLHPGLDTNINYYSITVTARHLVRNQVAPWASHLFRLNVFGEEVLLDFLTIPTEGATTTFTDPNVGGNTDGLQFFVEYYRDWEFEIFQIEELEIRGNGANPFTLDPNDEGDCPDFEPDETPTPSPSPTGGLFFTPTPLSVTQTATATATPTFTATPDPSFCYEWDFTVYDGSADGWSIGEGPSGVYYESEGYGSTSFAGSYKIYLYLTFPDPTTLTHAFVDTFNMSASFDVRRLRMWDDEDNLLLNYNLFGTGNEWNGSISDVSYLLYSWNGGNEFSTNTRIQGVTIEGIDDPYMGGLYQGFACQDEESPTATSTVTASSTPLSSTITWTPTATSPPPVWECSVDFTESDGGWSGSTPAGTSVWENGTGWTEANTDDDKNYIRYEFIEDTVVTSVIFTLSPTVTDASNYRHFRNYSNTEFYIAGAFSVPTETLSYSSFPGPIDGIYFGLERTGANTSWLTDIVAFSAMGTGTNPFSTCDPPPPTATATASSTPPPTATVDPNATQTPLPTYTFQPTFTPQSTFTPFPTTTPSTGGGMLDNIPGVGGVIDGVGDFVNDGIGDIGSGLDMVSGLADAWQNAPAIPPPGLPDCGNNPLESNICAFWYIAEHTIFSGIGSLYIPLINAGIGFLIVLRILEIISQIYLFLKEVLNQ